MRFRYAFQQIVNLKNNERTQAEWVLSEAIGHLRSEELSLQQLVAEMERSQQELCSETEKVTTISHMQVMQQYVNHLGRQIRQKSDDVRHAERHVEQKQQVLQDKMVDEKVWTQARERAYQAYTALMLKKEQAELDEIATVRFQRSSH